LSNRTFSDNRPDGVSSPLSRTIIEEYLIEALTGRFRLSDADIGAINEALTKKSPLPLDSLPDLHGE